MDMRGAFPALQEISTQDMDQEARRHFLAVLPYISSRSLTHLSLRTSVPRTEDMVQYLNDLSTSPATAQLRQLTLCVDIEFNEIDNEGEVPDGVSLASDVLAPLKPLSALTDIAFVVRVSYLDVDRFHGSIEYAGGHDQQVSMDGRAMRYITHWFQN